MVATCTGTDALKHLPQAALGGFTGLLQHKNRGNRRYFRHLMFWPRSRFDLREIGDERGPTE